MMVHLRCEACGLIAQYDITASFSMSVPCDGCSSSINIPLETFKEKSKKPDTQPEPVFEIGESVVLVNKEHVWYSEIGFVRDKKPLFYRLEIRGKLIWVPATWVGKL